MQTLRGENERAEAIWSMIETVGFPLATSATRLGRFYRRLYGVKMPHPVTQILLGPPSQSVFFAPITWVYFLPFFPGNYLLVGGRGRLAVLSRVLQAFSINS